MIPIDPNAYQNLQALVKAAFPDLLRVNEVQAKQFSQFQTGDHYTAQITNKNRKHTLSSASRRKCA